MHFGLLKGHKLYWAQRNWELKSIIQFEITEGQGLPAFFTTGRCAGYYFKYLMILLEKFPSLTTGNSADLSNRNLLFKVLQQNTHKVSYYFDLRTQAYFNLVMGPAFGVDTYWYKSLQNQEE